MLMSKILKCFLELKLALKLFIKRGRPSLEKLIEEQCYDLFYRLSQKGSFSAEILAEYIDIIAEDYTPEDFLRVFDINIIETMTHCTREI